MNLDDDTSFHDTPRDVSAIAPPTKRRFVMPPRRRQPPARLPEHGHTRHASFAARLVLVSTFTVLLLLALATLFVGRQRLPLPRHRSATASLPTHPNQG